MENKTIITIRFKVHSTKRETGVLWEIFVNSRKEKEGFSSSLNWAIHDSQRDSKEWDIKYPNGWYVVTEGIIDVNKNTSFQHTEFQLVADEEQEIKQTVLDLISDLVSNFTYYDRKESEFSEQDLNNAVKSGIITVDEMSNHFKKCLSEINWDD